VTSGSRVLLAGDAATRPAGLERALTRAGFVVAETGGTNGFPPADAVLLTIAGAGEADLCAVAGASGDDLPPVIVVVAGADPDAPAAVLGAGADDVVAAPIHLPELCARIHARIRDRQCPRATIREAAVRRSLDGLIGQGRLTLRPDEVVLALVRRLARAFDLVSCSYVAVGAEGGEARIVAEVGQGPVGVDDDTLLDPTVHPAITEAIRTRRAAPVAGGAGAVLPAMADGHMPGVLVIRRREEHPGLSSAQLQFAASLAEAAARALAATNGEHSGNGAGHQPRATAPPGDQTLDQRLQEEYERARRYALSFSLVLLDLGSAPDDAGDRLRRGLRLPDFISRYEGGELAIVLPETGLDGAVRSLARIRQQLGIRVGDGDGFSAGVVTYPHPAVTQADDMFALVEAALARGKAQVSERIGIAE
jgi:CheY-like chemotaxis protein